MSNTSNQYNFISLNGQTFGKLTVIKRGEDRISPGGQKTVRWWCQCDCGNPNLILVPSQNLRSGKTKSCGCFKLEKSLNRRNCNDYDLTNDYGIGYTSKEEKFYFDLEDYESIKKYYWRINDQGYVVSYFNNNDVRMHRIIMNLTDDDSVMVDHISGNRNDNRKCNLRTATAQENTRNHDIRTDNTSGVTGVYLYKRTKKWIAYIDVDGERIHLGTHDNFDDAVEARKEAEEKYFGEFSYDNSMKQAEEYKIEGE